MENEATTPAVSQDTGAAPAAQPAEQPAEAVQSTPNEPIVTDQSDDSPAADAPASDEPASSSEDDITSWLSKKGIDPSSPEAMAKVAEMARNAEKAMHKNAQERAEAQRQLAEQFKNTADPNDQSAYLAGEVQELKLKDLARDFVNRHPDVQGDNLTNFAGYIKADPALETLATAGVLSLDQVYAMYQSSPTQADKLKEQGGQEALKKLANKQRATAVSGSASSPSPSKPTGEDAFLKGFNNPF